MREEKAPQAQAVIRGYLARKKTRNDIHKKWKSLVNGLFGGYLEPKTLEQIYDYGPEKRFNLRKFKSNFDTPKNKQLHSNGNSQELNKCNMM